MSERTQAQKDATAYWSRAFVPYILEACGQEDDERCKQMIAVISHPHWVPARPPAVLPPLWQIVCHWAKQQGPFIVDLETPHCFACGTVAPFEPGPLAQQWNGAGGWLQKGHLVNRARDGLDGVQNLVPLCKFCNHQMPEFGLGQGGEAIAWVLAGGGAARLHASLKARGLMREEPVMPELAPRSRRKRAPAAGQDTLF